MGTEGKGAMGKRYIFTSILLLFCLLALPAVAQESTPEPASEDAASEDAASPLETTAYQRVNLFTGPGVTFQIIDRIPAGAPITIIARNSSGTWVHVQRENGAGVVYANGWVISGYLNLAPELNFGDLPINNTVGDADLNADRSQLQELYAVPVIPTISDAMREVYRRGREEFRNYAHVITKVGDSISADDLYLEPMSNPNYRLGAYRYLEPTIRYFGASTSVDSVAARIGMTTYTIFDPGWADNALCEPRETPLDCEYRRKRPSVSFIMFGPNDLLRMGDQQFDTQIRLIVENTLARGIIPVLSTFSYDPGMGLWLQSVNFNRRLAAIAAEYEVPIINLWLAARSLPAYGLEVDHIHMKHWGTTYLKFDTGNVAFSGASLRNLLTIRTLDEIRNTVILPYEAARAAATPQPASTEPVSVAPASTESAP